jgi:uncharacterized membrane protein
MSIRPEDSARRFFHRDLQSLSSHERRVLDHILREHSISRNTGRDFFDERTLGERLSDRIAAFGGSWPFLILFAAVIFGWILLNSVLILRGADAFDPYPFILLNLVLSMLAAVQAPIIMMAQNRQAAKDRLEAEHDYEVNLKAELEIRSLHEKLDGLREQSWQELVELQAKQIHLLEMLLQRGGEATAPPA